VGKPKSKRLYIRKSIHKTSRKGPGNQGIPQRKVGRLTKKKQVRKNRKGHDPNITAKEKRNQQNIGKQKKGCGRKKDVMDQDEKTVRVVGNRLGLSERAGRQKFSGLGGREKPGTWGFWDDG